MLQPLPIRYPSVDEDLNFVHEQSWTLAYAAMDGQWLVAGLKDSTQVMATGNSLESAIHKLSDQVKERLKDSA